ncbi:hypothetical protein CK203_027712 [Vitis vinifera]|uniref:Reverse transcriptase RNase H-like domain-containing protein n=1 Tax=Vitis vinifera TaxID=29760 RepID=A0A438IHC3_VITVI|nr:hypothetical protein CK203_027712 [Vitis vinifera]
MKLNSAKCAFGVSAGKFIRFMVNQRGIEGRLAVLGRFIARFTDKMRHFFLTLREASTFGWTDECRSVYYENKAMVDAKTRYFKMEQTTLVLKNAAQKLRPYFQAYQMIVLTNESLQVTLHKLDLSERMLKWAIELSEYKIKYQPRLSLKR